MGLIEFTNRGLYCPIAGVYIDPWKKVSYAMITHGHSDHARSGHLHYLSVNSSVPILKHRLGQSIPIQGIAYGESISINGVRFSFHPAGHITGSAMIRVEYKGEIWVVSGDYKTENDGLAEAFEPVRCHHFITECTFGLPVYHWEPQSQIIGEINSWWSQNAQDNRPSIITAYSLGKAQRIINSVDTSIGPIYTHRSVEQMNKVYRSMGIKLPKTTEIKDDISTKDLSGSLIVTPQGGLSESLLKKAKNHSLANASGWMAIRGNRRRLGADRGFVLSDHCDWKGLNEAIQSSEAEHIYPTHGNTHSFCRWLIDQGYHAKPIETEYGEEIDS